MTARIASLVLLAASLLPAQTRPSPKVLLDATDFARIRETAAERPWAAGAMTNIVSFAEGWPGAFERKYFLNAWAVPAEGGQWSHWYVCPRHGVSLQFRGPGRHECTIDNERFTGWPYEQVIFSRQHDELATYARDLGLAYRFTGNERHAREAAKILSAYAQRYAQFPIHDKDNRLNTRSGARVHAQTLDESIWLIWIAWAFDLIEPVLEPAERTAIERNLLRPAAEVVLRNDMRESNWQSWHNAGVGAVGFALDDSTLINRAIDSFRNQMRVSISADGPWYEGAWGYHFYALQALVYLAEMSSRAGIDLWAEAPLRRMFESPLVSAMPDLTLPAFNDSGPTDLVGVDRWFEFAYNRYRDPLLLQVLGLRARGREALLWGVADLPEGSRTALGSTLQPASGNAFLRNAESDHTVAFKFGPHGGGHGHYDKLNFVSFARGGTMAVDPGTQPYGAPSHETWDKVTVAHNTIVLDQRTQRDATGSLHQFVTLPSVSVASANAGNVYPAASIDRTLLLTPEYLLDLASVNTTDGLDHQIDLVYHNFGRLEPGLALEPYSAFPKNNGYQHLTNTRAAVTGDAWRSDFDMNGDLLTNFGSFFASPTGIGASFRYSMDQAASGRFSGRLTYDFANLSGYVVYSIPSTKKHPMPSGASLMIYGDASGNKLSIRLYDSTDERFVVTVGPVDWTGWRLVSVREIAKWSHYLGNNDGVLDLPVRQVAIEIGSMGGKPVQGTLYVDDVRLDFEDGEPMTVADFERQFRSLRYRMLGEAGTTVVAGEGLGPDLRRNVPFLMARRAGKATHFVSLLEPFGADPAVQEFRREGEGSDAVIVSAGEFQDWIAAGTQTLRFLRTRNGRPGRGALAGATRVDWNGRPAVELSAAGTFQIDWQADGVLLIAAPEANWTGEMRVLAPDSSSVLWNGEPASFRREGDTIVIERK